MVITLRCIFALFLLFFGSIFFSFGFELITGWRRISIENRCNLVGVSCLSGLSFFLLLAVGAWLNSTSIF